jgi:hypothetical protein
MEYGFKDFVFLNDLKDSAKWPKIEFAPPIFIQIWSICKKLIV